MGLVIGFAQIGIPGLILIVALALIIFGPNKLPEMGKAAGQTLREFKNSTRDVLGDEKDDDKDSDSEEKR